MTRYPSHLNTLIAHLRKLPGVGLKTAERFAFQMLSWNENQLLGLGSAIAEIKEKITSCPECFCLKEENYCPFCDLSKRDPTVLCVVSTPKDIYPIEETRVYKGLYHVLGGLLSPIDGKTPDTLNIENLKKRIKHLSIQDLILALDPTIEGDATSLYLKQELTSWGIKVSRLALGLPLGSTLDFVDGGTLAKAFLGRQQF